LLAIRALIAFIVTGHETAASHERKQHDSFKYVCGACHPQPRWLHYHPLAYIHPIHGTLGDNSHVAVAIKYLAAYRAIAEQCLQGAGSVPDGFSRVSVSDQIPLWHFLCER